MTFYYEPVAVHQDARGLVLEPVDIGTLRSQANAHLVVTSPGGIRGNHYHSLGAEVSTMVGPALVRVRLPSGLKDIHVPPGQAYRFFFPPGLPHAIQNTGQAPLILVAFNSVIHDPDKPDVVRDVLIEPSPD